MEVDKQMVARSRLQEVEAVVHVHLVVAGEEVDLHASHTHLLAPGELFLTILGLVQTVFGGRCPVDPSNAGVVPDHRLDALLLCVGDGVLDGLALVGRQLVHLVPFGIDEHVGQTECRSHIDILLDDVVVVRAVIVCPIDPGNHAGLYPTRILQLTRIADIRDEGRLHHICETADDGHTPRGISHNIYSIPLLRPSPLMGFKCAVCRHDLKEFFIVIKARRTLSMFDIGLGEEYEQSVLRFE